METASCKVMKIVFVLQRKKMLLFTIGPNPVKHVFCEEMWQDRMGKVSMDRRLLGIIKSVALWGEALAESCTTGTLEPEQGPRKKPAVGSLWLFGLLTKAAHACGSQAAPSYSCVTGPRARSALPPQRQVFLLKLWKINTELLMMKPSACRKVWGHLP